MDDEAKPDEFETEKILRHRVKANGTVEFLTQ